jgi:hypothetical protein
LHTDPIFPESPAPKKRWKLLKMNGGSIQVPLTELREIAAGDEELRSLIRR